MSGQLRPIWTVEDAREVFERASSEPTQRVVEHWRTVSGFEGLYEVAGRLPFRIHRTSGVSCK